MNTKSDFNETLNLFIAALKQNKINKIPHFPVVFMESANETANTPPIILASVLKFERTISKSIVLDDKESKFLFGVLWQLKSRNFKTVDQLYFGQDYSKRDVENTLRLLEDIGAVVNTPKGYAFATDWTEPRQEKWGFLFRTDDWKYDFEKALFCQSLVEKIVMVTLQYADKTKEKLSETILDTLKIGNLLFDEKLGSGQLLLRPQRIDKIMSKSCYYAQGKLLLMSR